MAGKKSRIEKAFRNKTASGWSLPLKVIMDGGRMDTSLFENSVDASLFEILSTLLI